MTSPVSHHFHFFGNREVTSLYFTVALVRFSTTISNVFVPVYLWQIGYPIWQIILFYLLRSIAYVILGFSTLGIIRRLTDKSLLVLSIPFFAGFFALLPFLEFFPVLFWIIPIIFALRDYFFNTGFHIDFSSSSDKKDLGKEVGTRMLIGSLVSLSSPLLGGILISITGFSQTFFATSFILVLAILPLLFFPKRRIPQTLTAKNVWKACFDRSVMPYTISGIGYATENVIGEVLWKLFLFLAIGGIQIYGGLISLGLLISAFITFISGTLFDKGKQKNVLTGTTILSSLIWGARIFSFTPLIAAVNHMALQVSYPAQLVAWSSQFYKLSQTANDRAVFIVSREIVINMTRMVILSTLMLLAMTLSSTAFFQVSFLFAAIGSLFFLFSNKQTYKLTI